MQIKYVANGMKRDVRESVGRALIASKIARAVYETRVVEPETVEVAEVEQTKPRRKYRRRDMVAEG